MLAARPKRIEFVVGTQINGAPHLGTNLVQTAAFLLAKTARHEFSIDTIVRFGALDNAPHDVVLDPETHHAYQQTYFHALGKDKIDELIEGYYQAFFRSLSAATDTDYLVETYTHQQATSGFRAEFLRTLERLDDIRWWMAPSHGVVHIRVLCTECGWAEKRADRTKLAHLDEDGATFTAVCLDHGAYEAHIDPEDDQPYLDLATLYRNLVKERAFGRHPGVLHVMLKGGDWAFGCQLVDGALGALGTSAGQMPIRVFTPQVLAPTGAKLSKSLLREQGHAALPPDVEPWMLDTTAWIRFKCQGDQVLTRVTKVARYTSFEEMFDHEAVASVNPTATREEQLANIRQIYPPEREALGVVAIGIALVVPSDIPSTTATPSHVRLPRPPVRG